MRAFLLSTASAALILAAPAAFAADDNHNNDKHHAHATEHAAPKVENKGGSHMGSATSHSATWTEHGHVKTTASPATPYNAMAAHGYRNRNNQHDNNNRRGNNDRYNRGHDRNGHDNWQGRSGNSRGGVGITINFNRRNVRAEHHYHYRGGEWRWPGGYHYQRWSFGMNLPSVFWARDYWINDYSDYGLAYPPEGCVWVRYGNDALLIRQDNGEILEVVYGQFD